MFRDFGGTSDTGVELRNRHAGHGDAIRMFMHERDRDWVASQLVDQNVRID